ncbi:GAF domain-containing protein [Kribbella sancticallisti]|uniref:GAF domain-containing protein n=1 Tax=Kribbella sancticallisti TaxID=460087 RepID=A0ABP4PKI0_9ACTN
MTDRTAVPAKLARLAAANASRRHLADRLCEAGRVILGANGAWITVQDGTAQRLPLSFTDQVATGLEDLQDVVGQGPCHDAYLHGRPIVMTVDDQPDPRWPEFSRAAWHEVGRVTVHAFPMRPGETVLGVLGLYSTGTDLAESDATAQFLADAIGAALLRDPVPGLGSGEDGMWSARAEVHQATGMVIAQLRIPADDALAILRAHAYAHDTTLTEIAGLVIARRIDFRGDS